MANIQTPENKQTSLREKLDQMTVEELERLEQLANIGELVGGFAHELRNPVAGIKAALQTLSRGVDQDDPQYSVYQEVCSAAGRLDGLVASLLSFARMGKPTFSPVNINHCVREAIQHFQTNTARLRIQLAEDAPELPADARLIQQVVLNLLNNAQQAAGDDVELSVSTQYTPPRSANDAASGPSQALHRCQHGFVQIRVSDNGPGVNEPDLEAVFRPFFTTKENGAGLGLAISHRIIQEHHGCLYYRNNPKQGATFVACLPLPGPSNPCDRGCA